MASALFGGTASGARSKNLVEFKAGKMTLSGKMVKPDLRKGLIYVYQSDDSLMHFCWKDRTTGVVEDDLMIFPDDIEYKRVTQCTTGRVYLMRFKSSNKKFFFWMQEPDAEKDEKLWRKLNDYLNNPPPPGSSSSGLASERGSASLASAFSGEFGGLGSSDLSSLLGSMNEQQIQQLFGIGGLIPVNSPSSNRSASSNTSTNQNSRAQSSSTSRQNITSAQSATATTAVTTPTSVTAPSVTSTAVTAPPASTPATTTTTTTTTSATENKPSQDTQKIQLSDLQNILGSLSTTSAPSSYTDLSEVLSLDIMAPILANKEVQDKLIEHLPSSDTTLLPKTETELRNTFTTPQFKRAMHLFSEALQSGQLGPLMQQFNLPNEVSNAAAQGNLEEFAKAMQEHYKNIKIEKKDDDNDDKMDT